MRTHFPGVDPWLEDSELSPNVRNSLIAAIRDYLALVVRPRDFVDLESRTNVPTGNHEDLLDCPNVAVVHTGPPRPSHGATAAVIERPVTVPYHIVIPRQMMKSKRFSWPSRSCPAASLLR